MVSNKYKSLTKAYKTGVDNNKKTGNPKCVEPFSEEMAEILGESVCAIEDVAHIINAGTLATETAVASPQPVETDEVGDTEEIGAIDEGTSSVSTEDVHTTPTTTNVRENRSSTLKTKFHFRREKLKLLKEKEINKQKRHEEKVKLFKEAQQEKEKWKQKQMEMLQNLISAVQK